MTTNQIAQVQAQSGHSLSQLFRARSSAILTSEIMINLTMKVKMLYSKEHVRNILKVNGFLPVAKRLIRREEVVYSQQMKSS